MTDPTMTQHKELVERARELLASELAGVNRHSCAQRVREGSDGVATISIPLAIRAIVSALSTSRKEEEQVAAAREAFLNLLADASQFDEEPDGDETGDHTRFVIVTGWRQMAELAEALNIRGPGYMETWKDALDHAIAEPPVDKIERMALSTPATGEGE